MIFVGDNQPMISFTEGRRVSCRDLGQGDCQGWLHLKKEGRGFLHADKWAKRWLVLRGHKLYGYKDKDVSTVVLARAARAQAVRVQGQGCEYGVLSAV